MATISLTTQQRAVRTTVALKALMAVSGLIMVIYLIAHMYGNLKAYAGQQAFDDYSHHLRTLGEPVLPYGGALWGIRVVLGACVVAHAVAAFVLWRRDAVARGGTDRYASNGNWRGVQRTYASFTMRWGGVVILLFVVYHILHLTYDVVAPGGVSPSPYQRMVNGFEVWWVVASYTIALLAVGFHLRHGTWSALTTLGANTSLNARRRLNILAHIVAGAVTVGFLIVPFSVVLGIIR